MARGGKVLIPVFALGRAQEIMLILQTHWERMGLTDKVPIYYGGGLGERATALYKLFVGWTNERIQKTFGCGTRMTGGNAFDFTCAQRWKESYMVEDRPMVLLATPGMMNNGLSLEVFQYWAVDPRNTVVFAGYCVKGTVGNKVLSGAKVIDIDARSKIGGRRKDNRSTRDRLQSASSDKQSSDNFNTTDVNNGRDSKRSHRSHWQGGSANGPGIKDRRKIDVKLDVKYMSFSAHADARGIASLIRRTEPQCVVFVHGEAAKMELMAERVRREFGIPCHCPANEEEIMVVEDKHPMAVDVSTSLLSRAQRESVRASLMFTKSVSTNHLVSISKDSLTPVQSAGKDYCGDTQRRKLAESVPGEESELQQTAPAAINEVPVSGLIISSGADESLSAPMTLMSVSEAKRFVGISSHKIVFSSCVGDGTVVQDTNLSSAGKLVSWGQRDIHARCALRPECSLRFMDFVASEIRSWLGPEGVKILLLHESADSSLPSTKGSNPPTLVARSLRLSLRTGGKGPRVLDHLDLVYNYVDWKLAGRVEGILSSAEVPKDLRF